MTNFQPITEHYGSTRNGLIELSESDDKEIADLLVGHSVTKVNEDHLVLDDGTVLRIIPNDGGCSCGAGDYSLTELNDCGNVITSVQVIDDPIESNPDADEWYEDAHAYRIFVFADAKKINLLTVEGDDGNGYYGTGFSILVRKPAA